MGENALGSFELTAALVSSETGIGNSSCDWGGEVNGKRSRTGIGDRWSVPNARIELWGNDALWMRVVGVSEIEGCRSVRGEGQLTDQIGVVGCARLQPRLGNGDTVAWIIRPEVGQRQHMGFIHIDRTGAEAQREKIAVPFQKRVRPVGRILLIEEGEAIGTVRTNFLDE